MREAAIRPRRCGRNLINVRAPQVVPNCTKIFYQRWLKRYSTRSKVRPLSLIAFVLARLSGLRRIG